MATFLTALAVFFLSHAVPTAAPVRRWLTAVLGERFYLAAYSVLSLAVLAWLIAAAVRAPYVPLWGWALWTNWVPNIAMPVAFVLLTAGLLAPNPLSVSLRREGFDPARPGIVAITRHPVLWGLALWALAHIPPNGAVVPVVMFGLFAAFGLAGMRLVDAKRRRLMGEEKWRRLAAGTSVVPFAGRSRVRAADINWGHVGLGLVLWLVALMGHAHVIGVPPWPVV